MTNSSALPSQPLPDSEIHIWCASLNVPPPDLSYYRSLLSQDEVNRAERFVFEKDRNHYIAGRGLLRTLLGSYLDTDPSRIEFVYGPYGKPALKTTSYKKTLEFNLSHSKNAAVFAFTRGCKLGIDFEYVHPLPDMDDFARRFFSRNESIFINSLANEQKEAAFFQLWTCKEAFLKANGSGLTAPINEVEISLESDGSVELISVGDDEEQAKLWHLELFIPVAGYQAALAVEGDAAHMILRQLNEHLVDYND